ncbi:MAG: glutamate 5-kinase [Eubacterium sp.]|nr:glutamate 5-kinase [Eubacterium sp.]
MEEAQIREKLKDKKRVIIKIGSSSLMHSETGKLNLSKVEKLIRELVDLKNTGKDVALVSSGAIAVGRTALGMSEKPDSVCKMQACASIGQARLMMTYQKIFAEYNQITGQILMTKYTILNPAARENARNTFEELFSLGIIPVVNENDTVSTYEIHFGDNDSLSALVTSLTEGDLLILLSDIDGLYTDDPHVNKDAKLISFIPEVTDEFSDMAKESSSSNVGTGGMSAKLSAARIATMAGADMVIANGEDVSVISRIVAGENVGTLFAGRRDNLFNIEDYVARTMEGHLSAEDLKKIGHNNL